MEISVVIPTCNRKKRLLSLLRDLEKSLLPVAEVIVVDSGEDRLHESEIMDFKNLGITYLFSERSVCIQRNKGITAAKSDWIFLCDDDIEVPGDYLKKLKAHLEKHPQSGAVCGLLLQKEKDKWVSSYPVVSAGKLFWNFIFQLSFWGEIKCTDKNLLIKKIKTYYSKKGNHIAKTGWPVLTDFSGEYFTTPVFGLGASLIKKDWLLNSPFAEVLDRHGIGDNYGVAAGFPSVIHVVTMAQVYHHHEKINRLPYSLSYYRRVLALDYFSGKEKKISHIKKRWLVWSLFGNFIQSVFSLNRGMIKATFKSLYITSLGKNPYIKAAKKNLKVVEPQL